MALFNNEKYAPFRGRTLAEQLPYFQFEDDEESTYHNCHLLDDGSLGVVWKTPVPASYSKDDGEIHTINEFQTFIENLPEGYHIQCAITSRNDLRDKVESYKGKEVGIEQAKYLRKSRAEKIVESGVYGYAVSPQAYTKLRDTYMVISMKTPSPIGLSGVVYHIVDGVYQILRMIADPFTGGKDIPLLDSVFNRVVKMHVGEFKEALITAESTLSQAFKLKRIDRAELVEHYWNAMCPSYKEFEQKVTIDEQRDLKEQVFPLPLENDYEIVKMGDDYHGLIMMAMMPDVVYPDYLGVIRRSLPTGYTFFTNIRQGNQLMEKVKLTLLASMRARMASVFNREEVQIINQETSDVKMRMAQGRKIMYAQVGIIIHGKSREEVEDRVLRVNSTFKKLSVVPDIERGMSLQGISYSWPMVWNDEYSKPFARTRKMLSNDLVELLPIHGHWGGHENPLAVYVNRDGEVVFFDHTHHEFVNWHYAITGTSGSGKSFAIVDLTLQLLASGVEKQFLITLKDDYDRFAETLGKLIVIDLDRQDVCINPFAGEINKQKIQQWVEGLDLMLKKGGVRESSSEEQRLMEQIVQYAYEIVPEGDCLRPSWIRDAYLRFPYVNAAQRTIGLKAAEEIGSFCKDGVYGSLFDQFPSITEDDKLVVFNLQNVLSEKIADVIVNSIFTMLDNVMYCSDRKQKKHLLVDEMISMVSSKGGENVANQLKRAFRTYRSLNCMCGVSTQNEEDLTSDVGQAIIGNISKRLILMPKREMIPLLMQSLGLRSERHAQNIASLTTKPGFYSEFYLMSPHGEVVCRLLSDKLTYALATTQPDDIGELERLAQELNGDRWQAAVEFSKLYPNGVRAARAAGQV
ncbi:MAG TPA: hypothetical protein DCL21_00225 [Alphaproteobacteria bacterium]|nr:hypothetical protein [Alphaproteobacteria bacterium]